MKINILLKKTAILATVLFFALFSAKLHAQDEDDIGFDDDVNDEAPIDSLLYLGLIGGVLIGYQLLKKKETI